MEEKDRRWRPRRRAMTGRRLRGAGFGLPKDAQVVGALRVQDDQDDVHPLGTSSIVPFSQERMAASMTSWAANPSSPEASSGPPVCTCATNVLMRLSKVSSKRPNLPIVVFSST